MTFIHLLVGLMPIEDLKFSWFWFIGSFAPDIDHIFVFARHKIFTLNKLLDSYYHEEKYGIRTKTKYIHSVLGAVVVSTPIFLFNNKGGFYFFLAYIFHLLLDWPDNDIKQYLYPSKKEFRGFLPIFSKKEQFFTIIISVLILIWYLF